MEKSVYLKTGINIFFFFVETGIFLFGQKEKCTFLVEILL